MKESLLKQLQEKEKVEFGIDDFPLSTNIKHNLIPVAEKLLNRIPAFMPEYTLHDINHCNTILENIRKFLPDEIQLNIVELTILLQAVYLHDIGMVINQEDANKIKLSHDFKKLYIEYDKDVEEDEVLTEYIRRNHVNKSLQYIDLFISEFSSYKIDFTFKGVDLSPWTKNVILSHAYSVENLKDKEKFPTKKLIHGYHVNIQFLSILLRLGDILDFDIFRTPPFLYKHINPRNNISIVEWKKHLSVEGALITPSEIIFESFCKSAKVERAVRNFINWIEFERRESIDLLKENDQSHYLNLNNEIRLKCRNDNSYVYNDLELNLDYEKVLNILMGTELYDSPDIFIREVLQNAYDACKCRSEIFQKHGEVYVPNIWVRYSKSNNSLEVEDNGIGIDKEVFENYLIKIGRSYYKSKSFQIQNFKFSPISNFGIGIISCFMVSDTIEIQSLKCYSPTEGSKTINYILNINDKYIEERPENRVGFGTKIKLKLKDDYLDKLTTRSIAGIIEENMSYQEIPIKIELDNESFTISNSKINVPNDFKYIDGLLIFELCDFDWIEGYILVYQNKHQSIIGSNKISQQCFTITNKNSQINLCPHWLDHAVFNLNLLPPKKLQLKANRNKVHEDESLLYLKTFILEYLISKFKEPEYQNKLQFFLRDGRGSVLSGNYNEFEFLISTIGFRLFSLPNKVSLINFKLLAPKLQGKNVIVIHPDLISDSHIQQRWAYIFKKYDYILIQDPAINYFYQFSEPYLENHKIIVTNTSGLIYNELSFTEHFDLNIINYNLKYSWHRDYPIIYKDSKESLFCIVGNNQFNSVDLHFNYEHRLGKLLKNTNEESYTKRFTGSFKTNIALALENKFILTKYINYDGELHFFFDNKTGFSLKSKGLINAEFIKSLNEALYNDLLLPLKNENIIKDVDLSLYLLSEKDFPEWWVAK